MGPRVSIEREIAKLRCGPATYAISRVLALADRNAGVGSVAVESVLRRVVGVITLPFGFLIRVGERVSPDRSPARLASRPAASVVGWYMVR